MKFIFLFLFCHQAYSAQYFPTEAELLNSSAHLIQLSTSYFQTTGFFDETGILSALPVGDSFSMLESDFKISYGISKNFEAAVAAKIRNVNSVRGINPVMKTAAESAGVFLKYGFPTVGAFKTAIGARYRQTLYTNRKYDPPQIAPDTELVLGDDGSEYAVDFFSTVTKSSMKFIGNFSYFSPANFLSPEIPYKLEWQYLFTKMAISIGVDGVLSLHKDPLTSQTKPQMSLGATHLFNSINREMLAPYLGVNYSLKSFAIGLIGKAVIRGKSTDAGNSLALNISTGSEGVTSESIKVNSFKEYHIDGSVLKISTKGNLVKIDQGLSSDVEKGMTFDIYQTDYFGGNVLVASGIVIEIGSDWSNIKLIKKYKEIEIKPGFAARGY
jgi:hypothetical protein